MQLTPAVKTIIIINLVFFALTYWIVPFMTPGEPGWFMACNELYPIGFTGFHLWQFVTYMFMHGGWWHMFFNMWSLMIFGCAVEQTLGTKRFWTFYLLSGIGAALVHQALAFAGFIGHASLVGASGAIYGVMTASAILYPDARLIILPIPFPIKVKYLVGFYVAVEMYMGLTSGRGESDNVAHFAHLGGVVVALALLLWWRHQAKRRNSGWSGSTNSGDSLWSTISDTMKRKPKMRVTEVHASESNAADHAYNEQRRRENEEIDRILDKIRKYGYANLTDEERKTLFNASNRK